MRRRPPLTIKQILAWADQWKAEHGRWPESKDGDLRFADETWTNIDQALRVGVRGLHRGQSLARLLDTRRGKRNRKQLPKYTIKQILAWADAHHERTGRWPRSTDGQIAGTRGETWTAVEVALRNGQRGLPGGATLASLLAEKRGLVNKKALPRLSEKQILTWIDRYCRENGFLPTCDSGPIPWANGASWRGIDKALRNGSRGLRKSSLSNLIQRHYGVGQHLRRPPYNTEQILKWADEHKQRTGHWPKQTSGPVSMAPSESWWCVNDALRLGKRGLKGGSSLAILLSHHRDVRTRVDLEPLSERLILRWARAFKREHGYWPDRDAGPIPNTNGETWSAVRSALQTGARGLNRKTTLSKLFAGQQRQKPAVGRRRD